jgi:hypothetical protein
MSYLYLMFDWICLQCTREAINIQFKALPTSGVGQRQAFRCQVLVSPCSELGDPEVVLSNVVFCYVFQKLLVRMWLECSGVKCDEVLVLLVAVRTLSMFFLTLSHLLL